MIAIIRRLAPWAAAAGVGFAAAWWLQGTICSEQVASLRQQHAEHAQKIAENAARAAQAHQAEAERQRQAVAEIDTQYTQEMRDAEREISSLRDDLRSGRRGLYVDTESPAPDDSRVPASASTPGVDDAAPKARLDADTAAALVDLAERGDRYARQLQACQQYIRAVRGGQDAAPSRED